MADEPTPRRQIVALGGGGFSEEPDNPLLDDFVLGLAGRVEPRICLLPTASGDSPQYVEKFYSAFAEGRAKPTHLSLFRDQDISDWRSVLLDQDIIYVGGGSSVNMLAIWRAHGVDRILREVWENGCILTGLSAGMVCWFESCLTYAFGGGPKPLKDCLGLLAGSACPHYDRGPAERRRAYQHLIWRGILPAGIAADDGAALHFVGTQLRQVVSSRPKAGAYRVHVVNGKLVEEPLPARYLGA